MPTPKKSLGQHWLFDTDSLDAICDAAQIQPEDTILEIGPGLGTLTVKLTQRAKQVVAVEFDEQLARELPSRVPAPNLEVIHSDIVRFNLSSLPKGYKVVANVPYYITSAITRLLSESPTPPSLTVMLIQKEVAERMAAKPGDMSVLGVSAQLYHEVKLGPVVLASKFNPAPKVDSQVIILERRAQPLFADVTNKELMRVVKAGFAEKRKTLRNSLSGGLHISKDDTEALLVKAKIPNTARAEELSLDRWHELALLAG